MKEKEYTKENLNSYFDELYQRYEKPKTVKRKIAVIRALFNYLSYEDLIEHNPFDKIRIQFKEPKILPRTIHMNNMIDIIKLAYEKIEQSDTEYKKNTAIRDAAIIELLFSTDIRYQSYGKSRKSRNLLV